MHTSFYVNICFHLLGIYLGVELLSHMATLCLTFENLPVFQKKFSTFYIPTSNVLIGVLISPSPCQHLLPPKALRYHSECEVILMVLTCIFWWLMILSIFFHVLVGHEKIFIYLFWEMFFVCLLIGLLVYFCGCYESSLYSVWSLLRYRISNSFSHPVAFSLLWRYPLKPWSLKF